MRINILLPHFAYRPTGGIAIAYRYAEELAKRGHTVSLIHPAAVKQGIYKISGWCRTIVNYSKKQEWYSMDKNVIKLYTLSLAQKRVPDADVTIATACETAMCLNQYSERKGRKIYFIQDYELWSADESLILRTWNYDMKKIFISKSLIKLAEINNISNYTYIPNAINLDKYKVYTAPNERNMVLAMMCSTSPRKGLKYGIEALNIVKKIFPDIKVIGFGKEKRPAILPKWLIYYESPEQDFIVKEIYNKAAIFVFTSVYEGWGLPPMEAMACGSAVVSTACGGVEDYLENEVNGLICTNKNSQSIANNICLLIKDKNKRNNLIMQALEDVKRFDWKCATDKFEAAIMEGE